MSNIYQEFGVNGGDSREIMNARKNAGLAFAESRLLGMKKDSHGLAFAESRLLGMNKDSQKIRKPAPAPPPPYGGRKPVIIHTYSPKVIQTEAHNFMQLVQKLTGWDEEHKQKKRKQKSKNKKRDSSAQNSEMHLSVSNPSPVAEDLSSAKRSGCGRRVTETNSVTNASSTDNIHNNSLELYSRQGSSRDNLPVTQNCFQEMSTTASAAYSTVMAENSYAASSSCGLLSNMVVDLPHLFHVAPNYTSSQSLRFPCKQTPSPPPPGPDAHNFNVNPSQEQIRYVENLPSSSPATLGGDGLYNISELLPQIFAKDFEFQHLL